MDTTIAAVEQEGSAMKTVRVIVQEIGGTQILASNLAERLGLQAGQHVMLVALEEEPDA